MNTLTRREIMALVVSECKGRPDELRSILERYSLKIACVMRPPNPDREGSTGGGISVVVRRDTILKTRAAHPLGGLWVSVEPKGANPFNLLAFYMPTTSSTLMKRQPLARQMLLEWADICIYQIESSSVPTWVAAGDFNVSLGCPQGMGRRAAIKARSRENRERKMLLSWLNRHNLIPAHGTLKDDEEAEHTSTGAGNEGQGEPDYIFIKRGSTYKTVRTGHELLAPHHARHRLRTCVVTIPPPLQKQHRPTKAKGPNYHLPQYGDRRAWNEHAEKTAAWMREKTPILLDPDTTPSAMLDILSSCITSTAEECFSKVPTHSKHNVLRLYQGRDLPPKAAKHFAKRRRLRHEASVLAKTGDAEGARRKYLQAQLQRTLGIKVAESSYRSRLGQATSNLFKRDASGFFNILKAGARTDASPDGHDIPNAPDGSTPASTFPAKAGELFAKAASPPPAISTEKEKWSQFIPRPQPLVTDSPDPARKATVSEFYQLMFGPCDEYPPVPCSQSCIECSKRSAQYAASKQGRANRSGATLKGSKAAGEDGIHAELLGWMRDAKIDDPEGAGTRTTLATIMCDFFNKMLESGDVPEGFTHAKILPLLKPGKAGEVPAAWAFGSYRLLALRKLFDKVVKLLVNGRLLHYVMVHGITGDSQTGFMPDLSTEDAIFVMSHILQRSGNKEHPLYNLYLDIVRAYDNVDHEALCYVLETIGIPPKLVHLLRVMMEESFGTLYINGTSSDPIRLAKGVPQGDPLSCLLFAIFIASLPRYLSSIPELSGVDCAGILVKIMLYADDGSSPCASKEQAELMLDHCHRWAKAWQLELNTAVGKTMYTAHNGGNYTDVTGSPIRGPEDLGVVEMAQDTYRYLGASFSNVINWDTVSSDYTEKTWGAYMGLRHRSSIVRNLSIAQQIQLMKVFLAPYLQAFSPLDPRSPSLVIAERRRLEAISNILRLPVNASHLLLYSLSGCPTERAHRLRERMRLVYHFTSHPARKQDPVVCMPKSVAVFRALHRESTLYIAWGFAPLKYNWVYDSDRAVLPYRRFLPNMEDGTRPTFPEWPFLVPHIIKNFETAVSYTLMKEASIPKWKRPAGLRADEPWPTCILGKPVSNGGLKHAGFLTAWLTAPDSEFIEPDGPGMGCLGPGLRHPLALASHNNRKYVALVRAQQGCAALCRWPWVPDIGDDGPNLDEAGNPLTIDMGAVEPLPDNWNEYTRCPLCGNDEDSIYHAVCECPHPLMREARTSFWVSTSSHMRHVRLALAKARHAALNSPADLELSAEDNRALYMADHYFMGNHPVDAQGPGISEMERRIYSYRLLLAAPWAARNADREHHMARVLGMHFDGIKARTTPNNLVRGVASAMCSWGERWIIQFARTRRRAIEALPPPPPPAGAGATS